MLKKIIGFVGFVAVPVAAIIGFMGLYFYQIYPVLEAIYGQEVLKMTKYEQLNKSDFLSKWSIDEVIYNKSTKKWVVIAWDGEITFEGSFNDVLRVFEGLEKEDVDFLQVTRSFQ